MATDKVSGTVLSDNLLNTLFLFADSEANILAKVSGYPTGCHFLATDAGVIYENTGDSTTAIWTAKIGSISSDQEVYPYSTTIGDYSTPSNAASSDDSTGRTNYNSSGSVNGRNANVWVMKFTGLTVGESITKVGVNIATSSGNIRVKVYKDDGTAGLPGTLLGESGSIAVGGTGYNLYVLSSIAVVPASGNVWIGYEVDNGTVAIAYQAGLVNGTCVNVAHTYGSGPSSFGVGTLQTSAYDVGFVSSLAPLLIDGNTATEYVSISSTHPWCSVDYGSSVEIAGIAFYFDKSTTTATQIKIQTSPDNSTWTDKRLINVSNLTNGAWNYYRWNRDIAQNRYVRIYGNDGSAKVLAIWEIKLLVPTESQWNRRHGHKLLSSSNATLTASA